MKTLSRILSLGCLLLTTAISLKAETLLENAAGARPNNLLLLLTNLNDAETFTVGPQVFELDLNASNRITSGRTRVDLSTNGTKATNVLVLAGNAANTETVVVAGKTYTFKTAITTADGDVLVGASAAESATNLYKAASLSIGAGTNYGSGMTANTNAEAVAVTTTSVWFRATSPGVAGNLATTETGGSIAFANSTLVSGAGPNPATDPFLVTNIVRIINTSNRIGVAATVIATNQILIQRLAPGLRGYTCSETFAGASWSATAMAGGRQSDPVIAPTVIQRVPTATEETVGRIDFTFPFTPTFAQVAVRGTNGIPLGWNGAVAITGNRVTVSNSGTVDWGAATNYVTLIAAP